MKNGDRSRLYTACCWVPCRQNAMSLQIVAQHLKHEFRKKRKSHVYVGSQNALNGPIWHSYTTNECIQFSVMYCKHQHYLSVIPSTTIVNNSSTICKDDLTFFSVLSGFCGCRHASHLIPSYYDNKRLPVTHHTRSHPMISTNVCPSILHLCQQ